MNKILRIILLFALPLFAQSTASNFVLNDLEGNQVELNDVLAEGPVFINFWATWCKPCKQEMDEIQKLYEEFHPKGIQFLAISVDAEKSVSKVRPYIKAKNYSFTVLLDTNGDVARDYFAQAVPFSVLINHEGEIVYTNLGYKKGDEIKLKEKLAELIK
ncbi:MAG: TlpA family protein disulfide reductase [Ignavibacteria bacterium]|nr:MAG: TlpA family protein disulfide reductase [Ignavibacteria bacterium]